MNNFVVHSLAFAVVLTGSVVAQAQEAPPEAATPAAAEAAAPADAAAPPPAAPAAAPEPAPGTTGGVPDDVRFRFGVSGGIGFFSAANEGASEGISCTYYGLDLRFGAQITNMFAVYGQPTFGYYTTGDVGGLAAGGLFGFAAVGEATFIDRFFVGAGLGYTVYNSPAGISPILRVGGYPLMSRSDVKARRKGLMVGMDLRITSIEGLKTIVMPSFNLGYEAF